ncbi:MAG: 16S rRNA (uracil(1498)-N(3))-methyltransferase [Candidatus Hydrogenedentes bacterium]|nr:16S rRNA (uracil(1498)-N(3))-methyltransferase [Candidatus Hydrogenedentota bacterium]
MSHPNRFYVAFDDDPEERIILPREEAHHALRVARLQAGEIISLFNGRGHVLSGPLGVSGRHEVLMDIEERDLVPPPPITLTVAQAGLQQDKALMEVLRRAVEMGVSRLYFWQADHGQKPLSLQERWFKSAVEACKQCGRFYVPEIKIFPSLEALLTAVDGPGLIGLPDADQHLPLSLELTDTLTLLIGPEGDFSSREKELAQAAGMTPVSLGPYIYRSETASQFLMTRVVDRLGWLGPPLTLRRPAAEAESSE